LWACWGAPTKRLLLRGARALPYVALCSSVLALGLVAGFLLASPLAPKVTHSPVASPSMDHLCQQVFHCSLNARPAAVEARNDCMRLHAV
jgi:hypothetical protein